MSWFAHKHDWGLWRWQVEYQSDQPKWFITGRWIRYCKECSGRQYNEARTDVSIEKYRQRYIKTHKYLVKQSKPAEEVK